ncbi:SUGCT [Branchiostoma lanceolatum]|uniref:SUGCT protein n=1 Tax=Branchiostoma lanceolatum TaxID=7740 RepID=A0A8J9YNI6_BRALA|nr:SUGCT [Branchiostoma lanceolatum]
MASAALKMAHRLLLPRFQTRRCFSRVAADLPLSGIRVLDLTRVLAGPFATMILGDLGAEVIKVERPDTGDDTRSWGPPFCGTESAYFLSVNRNKKSIAVNLKDPNGAKIIKQLAEKSDVLVENYLPGKLDEMGLGYHHLRDSSPHLIYCSVTGYGSDGPYAKRAGYDVIAAAMGGLLHITGPEDGDPVRVGVAMTDLATGLMAHGAIMAALLQRHRTGTGQHIDCNLLSTQVACISHIAANYLMAGQEARRWGTGHESIVPYQAFKTCDGHLIVGAGNNNLFKTLCKVLELDHLADDPRYTSNQLRVENRKQLIATLAQRFSVKTTDEWFAAFEGSGFPYGPINNMEQVFSNPQVLHNKMILEMDHPGAGTVRVPGPAVKYTGSERETHLPPPTLGQHTAEVLSNLLQYTEKEMQDLSQVGAIRIQDS